MIIKDEFSDDVGGYSIEFTHPDPANKRLFFRIWQDGFIRENGFILTNALVELRVLINQVLKDERGWWDGPGGLG